MSEQTAPYGSDSNQSAAADDQLLPRVVRTQHLVQWKREGVKWAMLTCYDTLTTKLLDAAGIPVLLVGDSAANVVYGYPTSLPVSLDEMIALTAAVSRSRTRALVVGDLPFGSYQVSPQQAVASAVRMMQEGGAHAVKLEGGQRMSATIRAIVDAGIPVMAHIGFTPQAEHALGGYRVQGRGSGADALMADAHAVVEAGAFAVVLEMVPGELAARVTKELPIPTVGIGAGPHCDAQVLVTTDMLGMHTGRRPRFVKEYAAVGAAITNAAKEFAADVAAGVFPAAEHEFKD